MSEMTKVYLMYFVVILQKITIQGMPKTVINQRKDVLNNILVFPNSKEQEDLLPDCPQDVPFCENLQDYPENILKSILETSEYGREFFKTRISSQENEEIIKKKFQEKTANFICPTHRRIVYPKVAYNLQNVPRYIYNFGKYRQAVPIETCIQNSECPYWDQLPKSYPKSKCKQKFIKRILLSADDNCEPYIDIYNFASGCVCSYLL